MNDFQVTIVRGWIFTVHREDFTCESEPSTSSEKRGSPSKSFEDSSERTKI